MNVSNILEIIGKVINRTQDPQKTASMSQ